MRILFLCGSLEPGRDGVGDYVRRLAIEMLRQGHGAAALAFNDPFEQNESSHIETSDSVALPVFRIPQTTSNKTRHYQTKKWIQDLNPDIISIQFVSYAFHKKGLPFALTQLIINLTKGYRCHIMFHELWIGMEMNSSVKEIIIGRAQRLLIQNFVRKLKPVSVHTQTSIYKAQLLKLGVKAGHLPLFGNIPVTANRKIAEKQIAKNSHNEISLVVFGGIHPGTSIKDFAQEVADYSRRKGSQITLTLLGRCGTEQKHWLEVWSSIGLTAKVLGEQPPHLISEILANSSIGITTTPAALLEKSGSVATMLEHGLPVICLRTSWKVKGFDYFNKLPQILEYRKGILEECLTSKTFIGKSRLSEISTQFTETLSAVL